MVDFIVFKCIINERHYNLTECNRCLLFKFCAYFNDLIFFYY
jgi:hypothetical protein